MQCLKILPKIFGKLTQVNEDIMGDIRRDTEFNVSENIEQM